MDEENRRLSRVVRFQEIETGCAVMHEIEWSPEPVRGAHPREPTIVQGGDLAERGPVSQGELLDRIRPRHEVSAGSQLRLLRPHAKEGATAQAADAEE